MIKEFLVKLLNTETKAADGSTIPRGAFEEYLASEDYKIIIRDKLAWGGMTHKDRQVDPKYKGMIGMDDQVLVSENATHYITSMYFKSANDPVVYSTAKTFDSDLFAGVRKDNIINVIGMLETGVKMPVSIVIQGLWSPSNECKKIIRIKGFDFTQNNSFPDAGLVKTMSVTDVESDQVKLFSANGNSPLDGCKEVTKIFSTVVELSPVEEPEPNVKLFSKFIEKGQKEFSAMEVFNLYPSNSIECKIANRMKGKMINLDNIDILNRRYSDGLDVDANKRLLDIAKDSNAEGIWDSIQDLVSDDQRQALAMLPKQGVQQLVTILTSIPKDDPHYKELMTSAINNYLRTIPDVAAYSTVNSVKDRTVLAKFPRISIINRLLNIYRQYYELKKGQLSDNEKVLLIQMFIQDIGLLIKRVQPYLEHGMTLNTLYALGRFGEDIANLAKEFSILYRKIVILEKNLGFIPKVKYDQYTESLNKLLSAFIKYVFDEDYSEPLSLVDKLNNSVLAS